jgi:hypothetical protein
MAVNGRGCSPPVAIQTTVTSSDDPWRRRNG